MKKSFRKWLSGRNAEDVFHPTNDASLIRRTLKHWDGQHDYVGVSWDGVIELYRTLAKVTMQAAIESAGWYKYPSSTKKDGMDGKDWRVICTEYDPLVVINCHSCINKNVWTLNTTVFNTEEINRKKLTVHEGHDVEICALMWSIETAKALQTDGYKYSDAIKAMTQKFKELNSKECNE